MYKKNEYVVCKSGVCIVRGTKMIGDDEYYSLSPVFDQSLSISLPVNSDSIYPILTEEEADSLISSIRDVPYVSATNDKALEQLYRKRLYSGKREDLISVMKTTYKRNLTRINTNRKAGEVDTAFYEEAEKKLIQELYITYNKPYEEVRDFVLKNIIESLN